MTQPDSPSHTHMTRFRIPRPMWQAFGRVADRQSTNRTAKLLDYIRAEIHQHGDTQDLADLQASEVELAKRRARTGGRPRANGGCPA